ncbi:uncharacterized protein [Venturia canescens]|uniref:uncharacterized protein n=1 Tax=Venturia canescens TaxID=32260 RepID=UPI001C9BE210|nr:uncharacterized protein LOC122416604 [Venturia canescens]
MLKLDIVLCAAALIATAAAASIDGVQGGPTSENSLSREQNLTSLIKDVLLNIDNALENSLEEVKRLGAEPSEKNQNIVEEFKQNVTKNVNQVRFEVGRLIENSTLNVTRCSKYATEYAKIARNVTTALDECISESTLLTLEFLVQERTSAMSIRSEIERLRKRARGCDNDCDKFFQNVNDVYTVTILGLHDSLRAYEDLHEGITVNKCVHEDTLYDVFILYNPYVIKLTEKCVRSLNKS